MDRRAFIATAANFLAAPLAAEAQPAAGKVWRIGVLTALYPSDGAPARALREGLRALGYVEGKNIAFEWRYAQGRDGRLSDLAAELVRLKVDLIIADATIAVRAAMQATPAIPIVMAISADPVGGGLVSSLGRPGGNVTGNSIMHAETSVKRLQLLKETVPKVRRVAILWNPANPSQLLAIREVKGAARSMGVQLQLLEARGPSDFDGAFAVMAKERPGALLVVSDPMFVVHRTRLAALAAKGRLPAAYGLRPDVVAGGLMSYGPSLRDLYRRSATFVDKILKGAKPGDLPVEQPTTFELVINLKTAKALGLTIPQVLLQRANEIIQ